MTRWTLLSRSAQRTTWSVVICGFALLLGCSSGERHASSLSGQVTIDDAPLSGGTLLLLSDSGSSEGTTVNTDGSFSLNCQPGTYRIALSPPAPVTGPNGVPEETANSSSAISIPRKYQDVGTSELTVEIKEGNNTFDIQLVSDRST